jgi:hypothetical protein
MITRRTLLLSAPLFVLAPQAWAKDIPVTLYRDPGCGCWCAKQAGAVQPVQVRLG